MKRLLPFLLIAGMATAAVAADNGIQRKPSPHSVPVTMERFEQAARERGMKVFPRMDHAAAAREYGAEMRPAVTLSFGNPKYGTPFMIREPEAGIDFPPKAIVYEDEDGQVWIAYNSAAYLYETIFRRHGLDHPPGDVDFYANLLEELTDFAVAADGPEGPEKRDPATE